MSSENRAILQKMDRHHMCGNMVGLTWIGKNYIWIVTAISQGPKTKKKVNNRTIVTPYKLLGP